MASAPAFGHLHVLGIAAAEQRHELGVARDRRPGGKRPGDWLRAAEDVRQKRQRRAEAVIGSLVDEAAERCHEAAQLRTRLMENSGRAPALRAGHDGAVAVIALDARKLAGDQIQCTVPRHRDERLAAAALAVPAAVLEPAFARHRLRDASLRMHRRRYRLDHGRGIGVVFEGPHADDAAVLHLGEKSAPMGMVANELGHGSGLRLHRVSPGIRARIPSGWIDGIKQWAVATRVMRIQDCV